MRIYKPKYDIKKGDKFNSFIAIKFLRKTKKGRLWEFKCICKRKRIIFAHEVVNGKRRSCGCRGNMRHVSKKNAAIKRTFQSWLSMRKRCSKNSGCKKYYKNITIYESWLNSFPSFLKDVGIRPIGTSLDRWPNPNGNYEPGNVRWGTPTQQMRNIHKKRNTTSRYKGVYLTKEGNWGARIGNNGKNIHIGRYATENEAAIAYNDKSIELWGNDGYLNKIEEDECKTQ